MRISDWSSDVCSSDLRRLRSRVFGLGSRVPAEPLPGPPLPSQGREQGGSEFAVIPFLQGVEQVGGGVHLAVVFDLLVARDFHHGAVVELEAVGGVGKVGLLHQHALEGGGVEAEGGAALQALFVGVAVDVLEVLVRVVGGDVGGLGDRGVHPLLGGGLDVDVFGRGDVVGGDEVVGQLGGGVLDRKSTRLNSSH